MIEGAVTLIFLIVIGYFVLMLIHNNRAFRYQMAVLDAVKSLQDSLFSEWRTAIGDSQKFWSLSEQINVKLSNITAALDRVDSHDLRRYWWRPFQSFYSELAPLLPSGLPPEPK